MVITSRLIVWAVSMTGYTKVPPPRMMRKPLRPPEMTRASFGPTFR
jgi:hypothetical protein